MARLRTRPGIVRWLTGLLASVLLVAVISGLTVVFQRWLLPLRVLYILAVVPVAIIWGTGLAALTAVLSAVVYGYLFVPPTYSFKIPNTQNTIALGVFLVTAVVVGGLAARLRRAAVESGRLSDQQAALRRVATLVAQGAPPPEVFSAVAHELAEEFSATVTAVPATKMTAPRARLVAAADQTRQQIERDLHDGAQQRLVSLALQLRTAQAAVPPELGQLRSDLERVAAGLTNAVDELREYARGIHPAVLARYGLGSALKTLARRCPIPVDLDIRADGRLPEPVEVTAYYVVSEALTNTARHADASAAAVHVEAVTGALRVSIRDDGRGGADFTHGTGLIGLRDRVEALGGRIWIHSPHGGKTTLCAELPLANADAAD